MRNKKFGKFFMIFGAVLLAAALSLFLFNKIEEIRAQKNAENVLSLLTEAENQNGDGEQQKSPNSEMTTKEIDGYDYIGYLFIPAENLKLPVMAEWDYTRLKISPCRFSGSVKTDDLIICAHNYKKHFGRIYRLSEGDQIIFTDMDDNDWTYYVETVEKISPYDIDKISSQYALTLFTCTYAGKSRVVVRCSRGEDM